MIVYFDLEGASADERWTWPRGEYVTLGTVAVDDGPVIATEDVDGLTKLLLRADRVVGHNILGFDLPVLAWHHGLDIDSLKSIVDTMTMANLVDPPEARQSNSQFARSLRLDLLGKKYLGEGKFLDLKKLAAKHGGFHLIPKDHEDFVTYAKADVEITRALYKHFGEPNDYAVREQDGIQRLLAKVSLKGCRINTELLDARKTEQEEISRSRQALLIERYGIPTLKADGTPAKSPASTKAGKEKLAEAAKDLGIELPQTKTGAPSFAKADLEALIDLDIYTEDAEDFMRTIMEMNGARVVYATIADHLVGDRVHPDISSRQASGRLSITKPGLTVLGKRNGKHRERDVIIPDPGEVLISYDLSQVDCRAVAAHSQDPEYLKLFEPGRDSHTEIAMSIWGDPGKRDLAKVIGHAWNYGCGPKRIHMTTKVPLDTCYDFDRSMKERFPRLEAWKNEVRSLAESGHLLDNGWGRKMRVETGYNKETGEYYSRAFTQAPALEGQGAARDIFMEGQLRLESWLKKCILAFVHDETLFSVPTNRVQEADEAILRAFNFSWAPPGAAYKVPIIAEKVGQSDVSWGHIYDKEGK